MSETSRTPESPASALRLEDMSDSQILGMIERAASDPFIANTLLHLQKQAYESMAKSVQSVLAELNEISPTQETMSAGPTSVAALASAARQREAASRQKREFAELLVIGALRNRDNPDWDIFDETESSPPAENGLLALLQMKLPAAAL